MPMETIIHLAPALFEERERRLVEHGSLSATALRYETGVCAVRLASGMGEIVMLPFQGQQIWSARFAGRDLAMRSMFSQPRPTREYLANYGGFLLHCGATAMGVPTKEDSHPLHGELPNAPYNQAWLVAGDDPEGPYIGLGGQYQHTVAFAHNYLARPLVKLHADATLLHVSFSLANLRHSATEYMYMAHINFRPVDNGRLVYSAPCTPERVRVRCSIPSHVHTREGYRELLDELARHPEKHNVLSPDLICDPEIVFTLDYLTDAQGWAHSMQVHPDGSADYVAHRPGELDKGVRWICRTADEDALGLVLPATAEPEGYLAEKAKGNIRVLPPGGEFRCEMMIGTLAPKQAETIEDVIQRILTA